MPSHESCPQNRPKSVQAAFEGTMDNELGTGKQEFQIATVWHMKIVTATRIVYRMPKILTNHEAYHWRLIDKARFLSHTTD